MTDVQQTRAVFVWGWLRLVLGVMQMGFSLAALIRLAEGNLDSITWLLAGAACAATLISRLAYRGMPQSTAQQHTPLTK